MIPIEESTKDEPTHLIWLISEGSPPHYWTQIGLAWAHPDGAGLTLKSKAISYLSGHIVVREMGKAPVNYF